MSFVDGETDEHKPGITVSVRVKPLDSKQDVCVVRANPSSVGNSIDVDCKTYDLMSFTNDFIHWSTGDANIDPEYATQLKVYNDVGRPIVDNALKGYNCCVFAYGQTGSGKTYSMIGGESEEEQGLTPRICKALMDQADGTDTTTSAPSTPAPAPSTFHFEVSYIELYLEKVNDLLSAHNTYGSGSGKKDQQRQTSQSNNLRVRENPKTGPYVEGVTVFSVTTYEELAALLEAGNRHRHVAGTGMNASSSRSHAIFTLKITQTKPVNKDMLSADAVALLNSTSFGSNSTENSSNNVITCKVNLVDLAGSENVKMAQTSGARLKEGASINKSLLTLGRVIKALSDMSEAAAAGSGSGGGGNGGSGSGSGSGSSRRASIGGSSSSGSSGKATTRNSNRRKSASSSTFGGGHDSSGGEDDDGESRRGTSAVIIPYRESVLTFLLKQSLGGNSKSSLIATIRPGQRYLEETLSTLRFAAQAGKVVNKPVINESNPYLKTIASLRKQIDDLNQQLALAKHSGAGGALVGIAQTAGADVSDGKEGSGGDEEDDTLEQPEEEGQEQEPEQEHDKERKENQEVQKTARAASDESAQGASSTSIADTAAQQQDEGAPSSPPRSGTPDATAEAPTSPQVAAAAAKLSKLSIELEKVMELSRSSPTKASSSSRTRSGSSSCSSKGLLASSSSTSVFAMLQAEGANPTGDIAAQASASASAAAVEGSDASSEESEGDVDAGIEVGVLSEGDEEPEPEPEVDSADVDTGEEVAKTAVEAVGALEHRPAQLEYEDDVARNEGPRSIADAVGAAIANPLPMSPVSDTKSTAAGIDTNNCAEVDENSSREGSVVMVEAARRRSSSDGNGSGGNGGGGGGGVVFVTPPKQSASEEAKVSPTSAVKAVPPHLLPPLPPHVVTQTAILAHQRTGSGSNPSSPKPPTSSSSTPSPHNSPKGGVSSATRRSPSHAASATGPRGTPSPTPSSRPQSPGGGQSTPLIGGYLNKRGRLNLSFKQRWCVLIHNRIIFYIGYYGEIRGSINIRNASIDPSPASEVHLENGENTFVVYTPHDRSYKQWTLQALSPQDKVNWISAIQRASVLVDQGPPAGAGIGPHIIASPSSSTSSPAPQGSASVGAGTGASGANRANVLSPYSSQLTNTIPKTAAQGGTRRNSDVGASSPAGIAQAQETADQQAQMRSKRSTSVAKGAGGENCVLS